MTMSKPTISVVMNVWNGAAVLRGTLNAYRAQHPTIPYELIVVDDGSTDTTFDILEAEQKRGDLNLHILRQPHRGIAAARNAGIAAATAPLLLFTGADIRPAPHMVFRHMSIHTWFPDDTVGCLGFVTWDPLLPPTPLMVFLEHGGSQNAYDEIAGVSWVSPAHYAYGANLSLKTRIVRASGGYNAQAFSSYGWEDLEFGLRLSGMGVRLYYEPTARAFHAHHITFEAAEQRHRAVGRNAVVFQQLHPTHPILNMSRERRMQPLRKLVFSAPLREILRAIARYAQERWVLFGLYQRLLSLAYYDGVHEKLQDVKGVDKQTHDMFRGK